jgi:NTP pyrophosphatase (non-canonical NTP hydrolase)
MTYYIYHIPGKKIGVTCDLEERLTRQQGYKVGEYEILESSEDIDHISLRELELQVIHGYKVDRQTYKQLITKKRNLMKINVTEQTTTFPFPLNKLKGNLMDNLGMTFETSIGKYEITPQVIAWLVTNAKPSMYNNDRCFIYNKALAEFVSLTTEDDSVVQMEISTFDLIREWAGERGIYENGDCKTQYAKLMEESGELARAILKDDKPEFMDAIGDMVVVLTNLAALEGLRIEDCINSAYNVIKSRKGKMVNGTFVKQEEILTNTL